MINFNARREQMIQNQLAARDITSARVLEAFRRVPRHEFVPEALRDEAYADYPLAIGEDQTISQPYTVAVMTQALELEGTEKVLEIGTGSGYQAAILSCLAKEIISVERLPDLAHRAAKKLQDLGFQNVQVKVGDGTLGWPEFMPYEAIIVTAGAREIPRPLLDQLAQEGRMVIPVGDSWTQQMLKIRKIGSKIEKESLGAFAFVPLIGEHSFRS